MKSQVEANSGFTVLELLMTLGVAAVLTGIAVPSFLSWMPTLRLAGAARQIFADLSATRMKAISQSTNFQLSFNGSSYVIQKCAGTCTDDSGSIALPDGVTASASATPQFLPRGTANNSATITLSDGLENKQVEVSLMGRVKIL